MSLMRKSEQNPGLSRPSLGVRECSYEAPLVEEEIALLEEEVLPVIAQFLERADAIAAAREAWAEQQVMAEEPALSVGAVG